MIFLLDILGKEPNNINRESESLDSFRDACRLEEALNYCNPELRYSKNMSNITPLYHA